MYRQFFGFEKLPFRLRPDAQSLYHGPEFLRARLDLISTLRSTARMLVLMGAPGVGKTTLLEDSLQESHGAFNLCRVNQPRLCAAELSEVLQLQLPAAEAERGDSRTGSPLLVIDDAQMLSPETLRVLGRGFGRLPGLKVLLVGQNNPQLEAASELAGRLAGHAPRHVQLAPLGEPSIRAYIDHRLKAAGASEQDIFTADACSMIAQHSGGVARLINVLCDGALHAACAQASSRVGTAEILAATQNAHWPEALARSQGNFLESQPQARLIVKRRTEQIAALPLAMGVLGIGRAADNGLCLDARYVSLRHCRFVTVGHRSTVEDLDSSNGIAVNGIAVKQHELRHADQITIGELVLTYLVA